MGSAVFLSRILGLVREQVFAALFGASAATDAFQIAYRIPNLLRDLFAEGAMSAALVPTFLQVKSKEGDARSWQLASRVFLSLFLIACAFAGLGLIFAPQLIALYAAAFLAEPGKFDLTVRLARILMPFFPLVALAASFMAVLNACGYYFIPSFASALFNLVSISVGTALAFLFPRLGQPAILGMAVGVVAGGAVQALIQWPFLKRAGFSFQLHQPLLTGFRSDPGLRKMLALMIPGTLGLAATQVNILINSIFATRLGTGAVSYLNYSFRLMQFPIGIFGVSLAAATLPLFVVALPSSSSSSAPAILQKSMKQSLAINLAAAAGLIGLAHPIVELIFEHGKFTHADSQATAVALMAYALGLCSYSLVKLLVPICYALGETRVAVITSLVSVMANVSFNYLFVERLGFAGLALGTALTASLNACLLYFLIVRKMRGMGAPLSTRSLARALCEYGACALIMGASVWCVDQWLLSFLGQSASILKSLIRVGTGVFLGTSSYLGLGILLELEETLEILALFKRRWWPGRSECTPKKNT